MRLTTLLVTGAIALSPIAAPPVSGATLERQFDRTYPWAAGDLLSLRNTNGNVTIEVWDRDAVRVEADLKVSAATEAKAEEALEGLRIEVEESAEGLRVGVDRPAATSSLLGWLTGSSYSSSVSFRITAPRRIDLDVGTVNGRLQVDGVHGELLLRSTNGGITVANAGGSVEARTTNGSIRAQLEEVTTGERLAFSSTNGSIALTLPGDVQASLYARTTNGSIRSELPIAVTGEARRTRLEGDLNGGGGRIELLTTNGGIRLLEG